MQENQYVYFPNLTITLKKLLQNHRKTNKGYPLVINIAGPPSSKSNPNYKLCPTLILIKGVKTTPICSSIYCTKKNANSEMSGLKLLLKDVILELQNSSKNPIIVDDTEIKMQNTGVFVCDASARTSAKCIKSHSGNNSYE